MFRKKKSKSTKNVAAAKVKKSSEVTIQSDDDGSGTASSKKSKLARAQTAPDGVVRRARTETSPPALDSGSQIERVSDLIVPFSSEKKTKAAEEQKEKGKEEDDVKVADLDHRSENDEEGFSWGSSDDDEDDERPKLNVKIRKTRKKVDDKVIDAQLTKAASFLEMPARSGSLADVAGDGGGSGGGSTTRRRGRRGNRQSMMQPPQQSFDFFSGDATAVVVAPVPKVDAKFEEARGHVQQSHDLLEKADFAEALVSIDLAIRLLGAFDPVRVELVRYCVAYKLALQILLRLYATSDDSLSSPSSSSSKSQRYLHAHLSRVLADVPLLPHHRVVCIRIALERNMAARNYGIAASLVRILLPRNTADKVSLQEMLAKCRKHNEANKHVDSAHTAVSEYTSFKRRLCFSALTFDPVDSSDTKSLLQCAICLATLLPIESDGNTKHNKEQQCPICSIGNLFPPA